MSEERKKLDFKTIVGHRVETIGFIDTTEDEQEVTGIVLYQWYRYGDQPSRYRDYNYLPQNLPEGQVQQVQDNIAKGLASVMEWDPGRVFTYVAAGGICFRYAKDDTSLRFYYNATELDRSIWRSADLKKTKELLGLK